jgi:hypothetical protein
LLAVLAQGRSPQRVDPAWLYGVLRHQAAMRARAAQRCRRREQAWLDLLPQHDAGPEEAAVPAPGLPEDFLRGLAPASRELLRLLMHGLDAAEIRWLLGLEPAALRQRVSRLRRAVLQLPPGPREQVQAALGQQRAALPGLACGRIRRLLRTALRGPALGSHDPDGHLLVLGHVCAGRGN